MSLGVECLVYPQSAEVAVRLGGTDVGEDGVSSPGPQVVHERCPPRLRRGPACTAWGGQAQWAAIRQSSASMAGLPGSGLDASGATGL